MAQKGIQEPSILVTHLIQETNIITRAYNSCASTLEKLLTEWAISVLSKHCSPPEIMIMAIQHISLTGLEYVEVNRKKGLLIMVRTGSGQGDPVLNILFLAKYPINAQKKSSKL
jgi:hypothetical protein